MTVPIPIEDDESERRLARERLFAQLEEAWKRTAAVPAEELEEDVKRALEMLRRELAAERRESGFLYSQQAAARGERALKRSLQARATPASLARSERL